LNSFGTFRVYRAAEAVRIADGDARSPDYDLRQFIETHEHVNWAVSRSFVATQQLQRQRIVVTAPTADWRPAKYSPLLTAQFIRKRFSAGPHG
jgi:hypothetical protein